jgi:hypothetical protein
MDNLLYLANFLFTNSNAINIRIMNLASSGKMLFSSTTNFFAKVSTAVRGIRRESRSVSRFQEKEKRGEMITKNDNIK